MSGKNITVDSLSLVALHLETFFNTVPVGGGTGFLIKRDEKYYLITNWHVVSGRHPVTNEPLHSQGAIPNMIRVWHHSTARLGNWISTDSPLLSSDGKPLWREIDGKGMKVDVVALEVMHVPEIISYYPLDVNLSETDLVVVPSDPVSVIGFPFNNASAGKFPIWKTAHVASDMDLNVGDNPMFLVDAMTKSGMSGSPVVARRNGFVPKAGGIMQLGGAVRFLGVYSGRIKDDTSLDSSNLGQVWKPEVIQRLFEKG